MMSMHKLVGGDGYTYLTRQVAAGDARLADTEPLVAYYEATGTPPGRWAGRGLADLGEGRLRVGSVVTETAMTTLFRDGCDPVTGTALSTPYADLRRRPVVGYDLTFTVPKSVSVLWALGDEATRQAVAAAHRAAVDQALAFVERSVARTRVGHAGAHQVRTRGIVAAAFDHFDSRAGDPNLHTHVVLANKVQGPDRLWRSLDGRAVHAATVTVSEFYDGLLADELHRRLPVTWSHRSRGERRSPAFEIDGLGDPLLTLFSTRAARITEATAAWAAEFSETHGRSPSRTETTRARSHLTRTTRPAKVIRPLAELLTDWANRARAATGLEPHDLSARALTGTYSRLLRAHDIGPEVRDALVTQTLADAAERRAVWSTWNLAAAATRATKPLRMASPAERHRLLGDVTRAAADRCVHLDDTRDPATVRVGEALFTTIEMLAAEKTLLDASEQEISLALNRNHLRDPAWRSAMRLDILAEDQAAAVGAILTSGRALDALVGPAGSGKTTTLAVLARAWSQYFGPVIGLAPSASAARTLSDALRVPCETTAKWLYESAGQGAEARARAHFDASTDHATDRQASLERLIDLRIDAGRWRMQPGQLVVIDEASLADTRTLAALISQADAAQAKVILVGDHLQRGSVEAGGAFAMLARRGPTAELTSLWRFTHPWEARASLELRRAHPEALDAYEVHGAFTSGTRDAMLDAAFDGFSDARAGDRLAVLQAADSATVRELNARAHDDAVAAGQVAATGGVELHDGLTAARGDRVVTRRNDRRLRVPGGYVRNGALWDVTAVERDGALRVRPAGEGIAPAVRLPAAYVADHVELGYATTTARSQGITVDETHTVAAPGMAREDLYVAMSRGRDLNRTYIVTEPDEDCPLPLEAPARTTRRVVLDAILATTHAEPTATETWEAYHPQIPPREPVPLFPQDLPGALHPQGNGTGLASTPPPVRHGPGLGI